MSDNLEALAADLEAAGHTRFAQRALALAAELDELTLPKLGVDDGVLPPLDEVLPPLERVEVPVGRAQFTSSPAGGPLVSLAERAEVR
jgi:hypothetical protein